VPQARILGRQVHLVHTDFADKWRIMPDRVADVCEHNGQHPHILVLNYPGNPEGASYTAGELKELADVARRFQLIVLSREGDRRAGGRNPWPDLNLAQSRSLYNS
jgi:aspartate aminotransferase